MPQGRFVLDEPGGNLALDVFVLAQHLNSLLDQAFAGTGVTPSQYAVYAQLGQQAMTPRELGRKLGLAPATVSNYLNAIERRGHLTRSPSAADRRSHSVALTSDGTAKRDDCRARLQLAVGRMGAHLGSAAERDALRLALGRLDDAILAARQSLIVTRKPGRG